MSKSESLFFALDGTSQMSLDRHFQEIEIGGVYNSNDKWSYPFALIENFEHENAKTTVANIEQKFSYYQKFQQQLGIKITQLYDIKSISFDTTSMNTGKKNGIGALLNKRRLEIWIKEGKQGKDFENLIIKGCGDHIVNLWSNNYHKLIGNLAMSCNLPRILKAPTKSYFNIVHWIVTVLSNQLGRTKWKSHFLSFTNQCCMDRVVFSKVSEIRYIIIIY